QRDEAAEGPGPEAAEEDDGARAITGVQFVGHEPLDVLLLQPFAREVLANHFLGLPERERLYLREAVGKSQILLFLVGARGVHGGDKVERDVRGTLVQQLEEGVLSVRARLAPDDTTSVV